MCYKEVDKSTQAVNMKKILDCLLGVCAVIWSNTVYHYIWEIIQVVFSGRIKGSNCEIDMYSIHNSAEKSTTSLTVITHVRYSAPADTHAGLRLRSNYNYG